MSRRTIFYDYGKSVDITLPSRNALLKNMGDMDVLAEYTLCAVRVFRHNIQKSKLTHRKYVEKKAIKHNINMRGCDDNHNIEQDLCKTFMVNSYAMLDIFVTQYRNDIRHLILPDFKLSEDENSCRVTHLLNALKDIGITHECKEWILQCLDYYRYIRNGVAHSLDNKRKCENAFSKINTSILWEEYPIFANRAPNMPNEININDFYLYSACIKHLANYLVMALKGKIKWDKLGEIHPQFQSDNIPPGTNPRILVNRVLSQYNSRATVEERNKIVEYIKVHK